MTTEGPSRDDSSHDGLSDPELISAVRTGDTDAFTTLYARHHHAATRLARTLATGDTDTDPDTAVDEAFSHVLTTLQAGEGPDLALRPYLHATIRDTHHASTQATTGTSTEPDANTATGPSPDTSTSTDTDDSHTLATQAFHTLPERWQLVLWHTDVEADTPTTIAPLLGLTPHGVTALAYRARERLRQAYLQAHLAKSPPGTACATVAPLLAAEIRSSLSSRDQARVSEHLDSCESCTELHAELADLNNQIVPLLAPAVLGPTWKQYLGMSPASRRGVAAWFSVPQLSAVPGRLLASAGRIRRLSDASNGRRNTAIGAGTVAAAAVLAVMLLTNGTATPPQTPPAAGPPEPPASPPLPSPDDSPTPRPDRESPGVPSTAVPPADRPAVPPSDQRPPDAPPPTPPPSTPPPGTPPDSPPVEPTPPAPPWLPDLPGLPELPALPGLPGLSERPPGPDQPDDPDRPPAPQGRHHPGETGTGRHGQQDWSSRRGGLHRGDHRSGRSAHRSTDRGGPNGSPDRPGRTR